MGTAPRSQQREDRFGEPGRDEQVAQLLAVAQRERSTHAHGGVATDPPVHRRRQPCRHRDHGRVDVHGDDAAGRPYQRGGLPTHHSGPAGHVDDAGTGGESDGGDQVSGEVSNTVGTR
jgi:hypothetical protein